MSIDWKAVAAKRLRQLREYESWRLNHNAELFADMRKGLFIHLHNKCISNADGIADEVAREVAKRMCER